MAKKNPNAAYDDYSSMNDTDGRSGGKRNKVLVAVVVFLVLIIIAVAVLIIVNLASSDKPSTGAVTSADSAQNAESGPQMEAPVVPQTVQSADTVPDFSQSTTAASLSQTNRPAYDNQVVYTTYVMQEGDTLESIAQKSGITLQTIISVNQIKNLAAVIPGTELSIPDRSGRLYTVEEGDMLSSITKKFNLSMGWKTLQEINGLKAETIFVGQTLFIPDETAVQSISYSAGGIDFVSPLKGGKTVGYYNQSVQDPVSKNNILLDGLLISAPDGSAVTAAAAGTVMDVAYSTGQMAGFFVRISHDGGYSSYYCFLDQDSISVNVSDKVDAGAVLGKISASASPFGTACLLFKIEQSGIMLDPNQWFDN